MLSDRIRPAKSCCLCRRNEEIATLREELEEQCRMAGDARRASEAAAAELAAARAAAASAERERAALQQRLGEAEAAAEEQDRWRAVLTCMCVMI